MKITPENTMIGFIGLGVMGHSMAGHLLDSGFGLYVYNRTQSRAEDLLEQGAIWVESIPELARKADLILSIVGFPRDVEQVYLGPSGVLENARPGTLAVDMTTSDPSLAVTLYEQGRAKGISVLDAPVSGGDLGARNATLSIMVGGDQGVFDRVAPVLELLGKNIIFQGRAGAGQHTKMVNQIAIAAGMVAMCEALAYASRSGLDPETVLRSIGPGAAGSWSLNNLGPRIIKKDDQPGFFIKHFIKDMNIAAASARSLGLETPGLDLARSLYQKMADKGLENNGTQALYKLFH